MNTEPEHHEGSDPAVRVRPYALTGGRTRPQIDLSVESLVHITERGRHSLTLGAQGALSATHQQILSLATDHVSMAELSARTHVGLGATRVLVADLVADGSLQHDSTPVVEGSGRIDLLERVLHGLDAL